MIALQAEREGRSEAGTRPPEWLDPDLHWALHFWQEACGEEPLPYKRQVDPLKIPPRLWPLAFLLELRDGDWFARLMGTGFFDLYGVDVAGQRVSDFIRDIGSGPRALADFRLSQEEGRPVMSMAVLNWRPTGAQLRYHRVLLPFAAEAGGSEVRFLLGTMKLFDER